MKTQFKNVTIVETRGMFPRLVFDSDMERFHVWLDPDTLQPRDGVLYANLIMTTPRTRTRHLDSRSKRWQKVIAPMLASMNVDEVRERLAEERGQRERDDAIARRKAFQEARTHEAAPRLLKALRRWHEFALANGWTDADFHDADGSGWISRDAALIAEIDGED